MANGVELGDLDWLTILLAIVANIVIGFLWYSPMAPTGKAWMRGNKIDPNVKPGGAAMAKGMVLMVVGAFLLMFVFQHNVIANRDAFDLDVAGEGYDLSYGQGATGAFFTWLGFFVPVVWAAQAWENKPWSLFFVSAGYHFVALMIAGLLFAWRL